MVIENTDYEAIRLNPVLSIKNHSSGILDSDDIEPVLSKNTIQRNNMQNNNTEDLIAPELEKLHNPEELYYIEGNATYARAKVSQRRNENSVRQEVVMHSLTKLYKGARVF